METSVRKRKIIGTAREFFKKQGMTDEEIDKHNADVDANPVTEILSSTEPLYMSKSKQHEPVSS